MLDIAKLNGIDTDPDNDVWIQMQIHSKEDLNTDNLIDHGGYYEESGAYYGFRPAGISQYIPWKLLKDLKEGDTFEYKLPCPMSTRITGEGENELREAIDIELRLTITASQSDSRYRHYQFDEAIRIAADATC